MIETIEIRENVVARHRLATTLGHAGYVTFRKWGLASAALTAAVALALHARSVPARLWPGILLLPAFPLFLSGILILAQPIFSLPQRWILTDDGLRGWGFRTLGRIRWVDIREWSIEPVPGLPGYYAVRLRWASKHGIAGATVTLFVPPSVDIARVEHMFRGAVGDPSSVAGAPSSS